MNKKEMIFISAQPDDTVFSWQIETFIENIRGLGYENEIQVLVFLPQDRKHKGWNPRWDELADRYRNQNVKFFKFEDNEGYVFTMNRNQYVSLLRPHILRRHWENHPELQEKAIFYHDSDIVFTRYIDFEPFIHDDKHYLSNTNHYLNADYFDSKLQDVLPHRLDEYKRIDVLDRLSREFNISREVCVRNNNATGGAQSILKNIDAGFWRRVEEGSIRIRRRLCYTLGGLNSYFFESENKGFQSWCADMWALLWNLWARGEETVTPPELDFAWATDHIDKIERVNIYHDAGASEETKDLFFKGDKYKWEYHGQIKHNPNLPYYDDLSHVSTESASYFYVQELMKVRDKYYK